MEADGRREGSLDAVTLRQVRYFVAVARSGSFTAAAEMLHVSQPGIGLQIKQLEDVLGVALFERHSRGVVPSAAGRAYLPHALHVLEALATAASAARVYRDRTEIRLGVTPSLARTLLPHLLYRSTLPEAGLRLDHVEGISERLSEHVSEGDLDAAFGYHVSADPSVASEPLFDEALCVVGPPHVLEPGIAQVALDRLAALPLVLGPHPNRMRALVEETAAQRGLRIDPVVELDLVGVKRDFLLSYDYCVVSPRGLFLDDILAGRLIGRPIGAPRIERTMHLLTRRSLQPKAARALLQAVRAVIAQETEPGELFWRLASG